MARLITLLVTLATLASAALAQASATQESTFQDDNLLVYDTPDNVARTLNTLRAIGVDRIRVSVFWRIVAPDGAKAQRPEFDAADPAAYPLDAWNRYDEIVRLAQERGIAINFNVTSPAPNWATGTPERKDIDETFEPDAKELGLFVRALGLRYSGLYQPTAESPALPRVDYWTVWNEPNQGGWLTPQWVSDAREPSGQVEASPRIYRGLVDATYEALKATGHERDTILIGETAPKGLNKTGVTRAMKPGTFIRRLYCLDDNLQALSGTAATVRGCPPNDQVRTFLSQHPALFRATGWAHHPYELTFAPDQLPKDRSESFTIANLDDLSNLLRRVFDRYGQGRPGGVPLYLTEFGYQTNPPDPLGVTPRRQSAYLNQSEFIAWRNPRVRTLTQFLLVDDKPLPGYPRDSVGAWGGTFQSGLLHVDGARKPSFESYQLPIHLTRKVVLRGSPLRVWGLVRVARNGQAPTVDVLVSKGGKSRTYLKVATATGTPQGYVDTRVAVRTSGRVRLAWSTPGGRTVFSRSVSFRVRDPQALARKRAAARRLAAVRTQAANKRAAERKRTADRRAAERKRTANKRAASRKRAANRRAAERKRAAARAG